MYSYFNIPRKNDTLPSRNELIDPDNTVVNYTVDKFRIIQHYEKFKKKPININDYSLLKNEILFRYEDSKTNKTRVLTSLNVFWDYNFNLQIPHDITMLGVNADNYTFEEGSDINNPYDLKENVKGYIRGTFTMINTAHPGFDYLENNVIGDLKLEDIRSYGQNLKAGDLVEFYEPVLGDLNAYQRTLPISLCKSTKYIIRYRKIIEDYNLDHYRCFTVPYFDYNIFAIPDGKEDRNKEMRKQPFKLLVLKGGKFGDPVTFAILMKKG
jgi:hypothetical protein